MIYRLFLYIPIPKALLFFLFILTHLLSAMEETPSSSSNPSLKLNPFNNHADPLFIRFTADTGREIYILGSRHFVPLNEMFSQATINELKRLAESEQAILYTEHDISNESALEQLEEDEQQSDYTAYIKEGDVHSFKENEIFKRVGEGSNFRIEDALKARLWLSALILGAQANILSYSELGGTEYELEHSAYWKNKWSAIKYLESIAQVIEISKDTQRVNSSHNAEWLKNSILRMQSLYSEKTSDKRKKFMEELEKERTGRVYSWATIFRRDPSDQLTTKRNQLWVGAIKETLIHQENNKPFLIVVGDGHCTSDPQSFLSLIIEALKPRKVERLTNKGEWIIISKFNRK